MTYPSSLDELTDGVPSDGAAPTTALADATYPHDDHHRALGVAVEAIEAELGTDPSGAEATVKARIAATETVANAAAAKASNLSDLTSASTARTNLGLGGAATLSVGTTAGTVAAGDDSRLSNARTPSAAYLVDALEFVIDGGGSALTTGIKGYLEVPYACTITQASLLADQSGSVVVDIFRSTYSAFAPPTHPVSGDKLTASAPPTISSATKSQDATLTGWTTSLAAGDVLAFNVNSATTVTRVTCSLKVTRT